jgi:hypothetical protein
MKKQIMLSVFLNLVFTTAFSQVNNHDKFKLSPKDFSLYKFRVSEILGDTSYYKNQYNIPLSHKRSFSYFNNSESFLPKRKDFDYQSDKSIDNMPCLRPEAFIYDGNLQARLFYTLYDANKTVKF